MIRTPVLVGLGAMVPPRVVDNEELSQRLDTDDHWIRTRTGITRRHWAGPGTATGDLAVTAAERALRSAGGGPVDMLILATSTPDHPMPATAPGVAARLGLGPIAAFDVSVACAGFVYALATAAGAIAAGIAERVVVVGADIWSTRLNPQDRTTAVIFGDGAGAMVLRAGAPDEPGALAGFDLGGDGTFKDLALVPGGGSRGRSEPDGAGKPDGTGEPDGMGEAGGIGEADEYVTMRGKEIFTHAVHRMGESSAQLLKKIGWSASDIDWVAAHQANVRILHTVAGLLGIDRARVLIHLDRVGNTSAASIPLALTDAAAHGRLAPGQRVLMTAFGGGLSWGSAALTWPPIQVSDVAA
ncbi:beta-ketoacyl-ACP synthase III [Streptomyces katsurahamanus]|uniref:Beta-ketoacyl-[acyl-carrier-protein] synthase III n=1 Tax=Streptomyces katsurahamanus TaxID=2577098 RepID=A0ABW9NMV2_9ACTN|nr:beta-ketoacyl-ACP synthase III [Streptomyces katsurahamanus]MQS34640.1 ketoacyl-ACP synthase III [Streptomyces katsurahamanus]